MAKGKPTAVARGGPTGSLADALPVVMLVSACVALLVAVNPFGGLTQATDLPLLCFGLVGVCAALLLPVAAEGFTALTWWRLAWAMAALAVWGVVSAILSGRPLGATFGTDGTAIGWPVMVVGAVIVLASAFHARRLREMLIWTATAVLIVEASVVAFELATGSIPGGTLSNSSFTGEIVCLLAPIVFWSGLRADRVWSRVWRIAAAVSGLWVVIVGAARLSTVVLVCAFAVWGAVEIGRRRGGRTTIALLSGLGVGLLVGVTFVVIRWSVFSRGALGDFWRSREGLWDPAVRAIASRPAFGFGPDGYQFAVSRLGVSGGFVTQEFWPPSQDPHNLLMWFGVSLGVVGLLLVGWVAFEVGRSWRKQSHVTESIPVAPFAVGVLLYALSAMAAPAALQTLPIALIVLGASLRPEATSARPMVRGYSIGVRSVAIVLALLIGAYGAVRLSTANRLSAQSPLAAQRTAGIVHFDPFLYYNASIAWGYAAQQSPEVQQKQLDLVAIRRAVALEPENGIYQLELARTLASYGAAQSDIEAGYRKAIAVSPASPDALASYAEYLIAIGRMPDAKALLDKAAGLARSVETDRVFAVYYRAIGDQTQAQRYDQLVQELSAILAKPNSRQ